MNHENQTDLKRVLELRERELSILREIDRVRDDGKALLLSLKHWWS